MIRILGIRNKDISFTPATFAASVHQQYHDQIFGAKNGIAGQYRYPDATMISLRARCKFAPFQPTLDTHPSLYLGFTLPPNRASFRICR